MSVHVVLIIILSLTHQQDIISKVELKERDHNRHVSVRYYSECKDGEMKERSSCKGLEFGDEVVFKLEVTVRRTNTMQSYANISLLLYLWYRWL